MKEGKIKGDERRGRSERGRVTKRKEEERGLGGNGGERRERMEKSREEEK